jgi:hypothetical protein
MKNGQTMGFSAFIGFDPVTKRGAIVLHNMYSILSDWVAALPLKFLASGTDQLNQIFTQTKFDQDTVPVPQALAAKVVGSFRRTDGPSDIDSILISSREDSLVLSVGGSPAGLIMAVANKSDQFWLYQGVVSVGTLTFAQDDAGRITNIVLDEIDANGKPVATYTFARIQEPRSSGI